MNIKRLFRHLLQPPWLVRRAFSPAVMSRIEETVKQSERLHRGELRVVIEASLDFGPLLRGQSPRARACEVFAQTGVWDTAANSGVLLYINHADRDIEIVADRGISRHVAPAQWQQIVQRMGSAFRAGRHEEGLIEAVDAVTAVLVRHFPAPAGAANPNELPDEPVLG